MEVKDVCVHPKTSNKISKKLKKTKVNSPVVNTYTVQENQPVLFIDSDSCIRHDTESIRACKIQDPQSTILQETVDYQEKKVEETHDEISDFTSGITYSITQEMIKHFLNIIKESNNYNKIKNIIDDLTSTISNKVAPYLYSILAILIVMFFMNCFQFYYYLRSIGKKISSEI